MKMTKQRKVDAILTSDWHLREDIPICRIDDFWNAQWKKVDFISDLQKKYDCPVFHAGDLFHHWKPSPYLISTTAKHLPSDFNTIYGQHDLPKHSLKLKEKCGIYTLNSTLSKTKFQVLKEASWGQEPTNGSYNISFENGSMKKILVWHKHIYKTIEPWPNCESPRAIELLKRYPQFDLILTGDNHMPFIQKYKNRILVNPGSLMRQKADQIDFKPRIYLWYASVNEIEKVYIPIDNNAISREHIEEVKKKEKRLEAFISILDSKGLDYLDFVENLKVFFDKNRIRKSVKEIILESIGK